MIFINSFSHRIIGNILYDNLKEKYGIVLHKRSFVWGNICPDFEPVFSAHPHYIKDSLDFVNQECISIADNRINTLEIAKDYSKRIGVICHYYADFFCYAHSKYFNNNIKSHIKYESALHKFLISKESLIKGIAFNGKQQLFSNINAINSQVWQYQNAYLKEAPAFEKDLIYTFKVCSEAILSLVNCSYIQDISFRTSSNILSHSFKAINSPAMR